MPIHDILHNRGEGFPSGSGAYLVRLRNYEHMSPYLFEFVISDYSHEFRQFRFELYTGTGGTLEPTDITDIVDAWWHLPQ
jgi:hypothetical protein